MRVIVCLSALLFQLISLPTTAMVIESENISQWVDSVYNQLNNDQRLSQLIFVRQGSELKDNNYYIALNKAYQFGGFELNRMDAALLDSLNSHANVPLLISASTNFHPDQNKPLPELFTYGAIDDLKVIERVSGLQGIKYREAGIHIVSNPLFDINYSIADLEIDFFRIGNAEMMASNKIAILKAGFEIESVASTARLRFDFSAYEDISKLNAEIRSVRKKNDENWLNPIIQGINNEMILFRIDNLPINNLREASVLNNRVFNQFFRNDLAFKGLLIADPKEISYQEIGPVFRSAEEIEMLLIASGIDVIVTDNPQRCLMTLQELRENRTLRPADVERRVKRVLHLKYLLAKGKVEAPIEFENNVPVMLHDLYSNAISVVRNDQNLIPFKVLDTTNFATLSLGAENLTHFQETMSSYAPMVHFVLSGNTPGIHDYRELTDKLKFFDHVIIGVHRKLNAADLSFLLKLQQYSQISVVLFDMNHEQDLPNDVHNLVVAYDNSTEAQRLTAQLLFGAIEGKGVFPVVQENGKRPGIKTISMNRLAYTPAALQNMDRKTLDRIQSIIDDAIKNQAIPGCQILVARNGAVVYEEAYGYYTYDSLIPITSRSVYDIASITKVASTTQAIMFLADQGIIDVHKKISNYLPELIGTNKENIYIKDIMAHQAGLRPGLPFWHSYVDTSSDSIEFNFDLTYGDKFQRTEYTNSYTSVNLRDSLWQWTIKSKLIPKSRRQVDYPYKYSDLGFYMLQVLAERMVNQPLDEFMSQNFYDPMGMSTLSYNPLCKIPMGVIVPTEIDFKYRGGLVWGTVHDPTAAMTGGVGGHAGLFSNASDLAKLGQLQLNGGEYGDKRYFRNQTVNNFTASISKTNRRALGWDKPDKNEKYNPASRYASPASYGHRGFTGTTIWIDPTFNLVFVFLSNRVYPTQKNNKITEMKLRQRVQDIIYESIWNFEKYNEL